MIKAVIWFLLFTSVIYGQIQWTWRNPLPQGNYLRDIAYANSLFVAIGDGGTVLNSYDGINWRNTLSLKEYPLLSLAFGNGMFIASGTSNHYLRCIDGNIWREDTFPSLIGVYDVAYGNGKFVVAGTDIQVSTDGLNWEQIPRISSVIFDEIAYGNGQFVTVGGNGIFAYSPDGSTWAVCTLKTSMPTSSVAFGAGKFLVPGYKDTMYSSTDGAVWTKYQTGFQGISTLQFCNGRFYARTSLYNSYRPLAYSVDGIAWDTIPNSSSLYLLKLAYGNGTYAATGYSRLFSSVDAASFYPQYSGHFWNLNSVIYVNGRYIAVGNSEAIYSSEDGITWANRQMNERSDTYEIYQLVFGNNTFVALGYDRLYSKKDSVFLSPDAVQWNSYALPLKADSSTWPHLSSIAFGNGKYIAVGSFGTALSSSNGIAWSSCSLGTRRHLYDIAFNNGKFIAAGDSGTIISSVDGISWEKILGRTMDRLYKVVFGNDKILIFGMDSIYISTDGITWQSNKNELPIMISDAIYANNQYIAVGSKNGIYGELYCYGYAFTSFDGISWTTIKSGAAQNLNGIAFGNNQFIAVGGGGTILSSPAENNPIFRKPSNRSASFAIENIQYKNSIVSLALHLPLSSRSTKIGLMICNQKGQIMHNLSILNTISTVKMPVSRLPSGMYRVIISANNRKISSSSFILTK